MSIKSHLMLRLFIASLLLVGGGTWFGYQDVRQEARELFDAQLARSAKLILSLVQADTSHNNFSSIQKYLDQNDSQPLDASIQLNQTNESYEDNEDEISISNYYESKLGFQIWDNAGNLLLKSANVPLIRISELPNGFSNEQFSNAHWHVFSLTSKDKKYNCITAERVDVRNDLIGKLSSDLLTIFIVLIPALLITMWFTITQGLFPLYKLASQIHFRDANKLNDISIDNAPEEIHTITNALNQLLSRLKKSLAREKRVTSDAAHELRTPLAAIKLHAELAKSAATADERTDAIEHIILGINRTTHLVTQLLTLSRLEPESFTEQLLPLNLTQLITEETALLVPFALNKNIELSICENKAINIPADDTSLRLLIRNLINNAIAYTQENGAIDIYLRTNDHIPCLIIKDNGPGIPSQDYERVLERFYRAKNHETPGCGIGLSIVSRVVELHGSTLKFSAPDTGTGLIVTICFPKQ